MMDILTAVNYLMTLAQAAADITGHVAAVSQVIQTAQAAGRTDLTADEWASVVAMDDQARAKLQAAIDTAAKLTVPA